MLQTHELAQKRLVKDGEIRHVDAGLPAAQARSHASGSREPRRRSGADRRARRGGHEADPGQNLKSVPCQAVARNRHADARHRSDQVVVLFRKDINCFSRSLDPPLVQDSRLPTLQETQPLILHRQSEVLVSEAERPRRAQV